MKHFTSLLCLLLETAAAGTGLRTLPEYKATYENQEKRIRNLCDAETANAIRGYSFLLEGAKTNVRRTGDHKGLIAVTKEIERFTSDPTIPDKSPDEEHPEVIRAQDNCRRRLAAAETTRRKSTIALIEQYLLALGTLRTDLVRKQRVPDTVMVDEEIKRINLLKADLQSRLPATATEPERPPVTRYRPPADLSSLSAVKDGSFESGKWGHWVVPADIKQTSMKITDREAHTGKCSLQYGEYTRIEQKIHVAPGIKYRVSYWIKVVKPGNGQAGGICIDAPKGPEQRITEAADWQERTLEFKAAKPEHTLVIWGNRPGIEAYIDDVVAVPITE